MLESPTERGTRGATVEDSIEAYRGELVAHCYRLLGASVDAQDAAQDALLRAWRRSDTFDPSRGSLRTWLYAIATNTCLDLLRTRRRRSMAGDLVAPADPGDPMGAVAPPESWVEPIPDAAIRSAGEDPAIIAMRRASVRLALVAAWQHLPPRQRAVLLLRDVLGFTAADVASQLGTTAAAVNSALQRARATLERADLSETDVFDVDDEHQRATIDRYLDALDRQDIDAQVRMLREDATMTMPPLLWWLDGRDAIETAWRADPAACAGTRVFPTLASGQAAFVQYVADDGGSGHVPRSLTVIETVDLQITRLTVHLDVATWLPAFGFPLDGLPGGTREDLWSRHR